MKRLLLISLVGVVTLVSGAVGATPRGESWFWLLHEQEEAREYAQERAKEAALELAELDEFLGGALTDADTAQRATARLRRQVSAQVAAWEMAERRAWRVAVLEDREQGRGMQRALALGRPQGARDWQSKADLLEAVAEWQGNAGELMRRRGELTTTYAQYRARDAAAEKDREEIARQARERAEEQEIQRELARTARDLREEIEGAQKNPTTEDFHRRKGALVPPISGPPDFGFGPRAQENSASFVRHTGLTYLVEGGRQVRSVGDGLVVFAGNMPGYGRLLIVDHGGGYHSLYAHLEEREVDIGDPVRNRQVLGSTGSSGSLEGPKFYFELRQGGVPVDPGPWFVSQ